MRKRLSVVTITFNNILELEKTYKSISSQVDEDFEWIVVDGGSKDGTREWLGNNPLVKKWVSEPDKGIYDAMRKGVGLCGGDYVWFLNSGDTAYSDGAVAVINKKASCDVFYFSAVFSFGPNFEKIRFPRAPRLAVRYSVPGNQQATIYRKDVLTPSLFEHAYSLCGDYFMSAKLINSGASLGLADDIVARFSMGGASTTKIWQLCSQAASIQKDVLGIGGIWRFLYLARRIFSAGASWLIYQISKRRTG